MKRGLIPAAWLLTAIPAPAQSPLIARARSLEPSTPYVPPPGDPLEHHAAGLAKVVCSAVFVTGLAPEFAVQNLGFFTAPYEERAKLGRPAIDRARKAVRVTLPSGVTRTAVYLGDQGCVTLPAGKQSPGFTPERVPSRLPDAATESWPMGDVLPSGPPPPELDTVPSGPYPDPVSLYPGAITPSHYAATRPLQWPPGTVGRYRNTDPVLVNYLIRLAVEKRREDYLAFPRRALFDKLGMRSVVIETDPYGDFLTQGYDFASARDWARLGNLYLQDGVWNGERILPEGFVRFVSTVAPAWTADGRPIYGGVFWVKGGGDLPLSRGAYFNARARGRFPLNIP